MKKIMVALVLAFTTLSAFAADHKRALGAFTNVTIPVMANNPGLQGAFFKTKVAIFNPTQLSYPIDITLFSGNGQVAKTALNMAPGQIRNYENFLQDVFSYSGAGAVQFDSSAGAPGGSTGRDFMVTAEVFT